MSKQHPPGPAGHWLMGNVGLLRSDALGLLEQVPKKYGDLASLRMGPYRVLLLSHPRWVEQVLVTDNRNFQRPPRFLRIVRPVFGNGLFASKGGATWLTQRRTIQSALDRIPLDRHCQNVIETARRTTADWEFDSESELEHRMIELSFAVRARATFGIDGSDSFDTIHHCVRSFLDYFSDRMHHPFSLPLWVPTRDNRRIRSAIDRWWEMITHFIQESHRNEGIPDDLLGILLEMGRNSEQSMPQHQLRDEIATWIMTGTETVANTLSWTWYLLANHPQVRERLYEEVDSVKRWDLESLKFTQRVLRESMRLYPQAYVIGRKAVASFTMGEFTFPRGTTVMLNQWFISRDDHWFAEPLKFDPDRWDDSRAESSRFADFTFGRGPRICAGRRLAMIDMSLMLATLAQRFDFQMASTETTRPQPTLTLRPPPGMRAKFVPR